MKKQNSKNNKVEEFRELTVNPKLPPVWVDDMVPLIREDGIALIRLIADLPEGAIEQAKFVTNEETLTEFVDTISFALDYYPKKTELKKKFEIIKKSQGKVGK